MPSETSTSRIGYSWSITGRTVMNHYRLNSDKSFRARVVSGAAATKPNLVGGAAACRRARHVMI